MSKKNPLILSFDGNIGSGKSTIVKYLQSNFENFYNTKNNSNIKICFLQEPVQSWEKIIDNKTDKNLLELFYEFPERYSFTFQINAYISRLSQFLKVLNENIYDIIITERSIFTDKYVFAKMLHDLDKINSVEFKIYNKWFDEFSFYLTNLKIIYIKTNPETCLLRVTQRGRESEKIKLDYLKNCDLYHELWLNNINKDKLLIINGNYDCKNLEFNYFDHLMNNLYKFIKDI